MLNRFLLWGLRKNIRGFGFFVRTFYPYGRISVQNRYGLKLELDPREKIDGAVIRHGYFDDDVIACLLGRVRPGDIFWDIGANIGLHSLTLKLLRPETDVVCFEPLCKNFDRLLEH